jgi:hypothetical protein
MILLALTASALAGGFTTCSVTDATAGAHGSWSVLASVDSDGVESADSGFTSAQARIATAFGDSTTVDLCPAGDPLAGIDLPVRRLGLIAVDVDPTALGNACPASSWARAEGVVEGLASVEPKAMAASATARAHLAIDADNVASISVDAGAGARWGSSWLYRSTGMNTRLVGTIEVTLADAQGGARINLPGLARVDAWDGQVDAWVRHGDRYEHVVGPAPMHLDVSVVMQGRGGSVCGGGSASLGSVADDSVDGIDVGSSIQFSLVPEGTTDPVDDVPRDAPVFDLCTCT